MPRSATRIWTFLSLLVLLSFALAPAAHAVQAGGSLSLYPTNWGFLSVGEPIEVMVVANNTSSDTPASAAPDDARKVSALLSGDIVVQFACVDPQCAMQVSGRLAFESVGGNGCVEKDAGVISCSASGANNVRIRLRNGGVTIPPGGSLDLATIRLRVLSADGIAQLGMMAMTMPGALRACSTHAPAICADCDASGCTKLVFTPSVVKCPHACPERIVFRGGPLDPDYFEFHSLLVPGAPLNPLVQPFKLFVSNANGSLLSLPQEAPSAGKVFVRQGDGVWTFRNDAARETGGVAWVKITRREGNASAYKIDIQAFDPALEQNATLAMMTVKFTIGPETFETTDLWTKRNNGWVMNLD
jgi:hypothetical protein